MTAIIKVCAIALISCAAALVLSQMNGSLVFGIKVASVIMIFGMALVSMEPALEMLSVFAYENDQISEYAGTVLRALAIAILANMTAGVCRDCGQTSVAGGVETVAKVEILILCLPMISDICDCAIEILNMS